jgi:Proteasome subunit
MFGICKVAQSLPVRNIVSGGQFLSKAAQRSFASQSGVSRSIDRHGTTILVVRKDGKTVMAGDGQVSAGSSVVKGNAKKVRRLGDNILVGFAGSTADALTLLERLEKKLEEHPGQLTRACVELAKAWRSDKYLRRLEVTACDNIAHYLSISLKNLTNYQQRISTLLCKHSIFILHD